MGVLLRRSGSGFSHDEQRAAEDRRGRARGRAAVEQRQNVRAAGVVAGLSAGAGRAAR